MGLQAHRRTHSKSRMQRAHHALKKVKAILCPKCAAPIKAHTACPACGYYNSRKVLATKEDVLVKRTDKRKKKEAKEKAKMASLKN